MRKKILVVIPILVIVFGLIYFNLPFEISRKSEIDFGNKLVDRIEKYQQENGHLPAPNDLKTLEKLGFKIEMLGTNPTYERINENEYELIYLEGFDGPYLLYNSEQNDWSIDFPTTPDRWKAKES
jgi:DNA-dependent RNA polymerase auxiliary subunit epsilon